MTRESIAADAAALAPAPGEFVEIVAGILWIRLPIPGAVRHINVWLVPTRRGWTLVDTGMKTDSVEAAWQALGQRLPLAGRLEAILVTHHHPDHFGMARRLAELHDAPVLMTEPANAASRVELDDRHGGPAPRGPGFVERLGIELDEPMAAILRGGAYRRVVSGMPETSIIDRDDELEGADHAWTVSIHHGHAPGHACLREPASGLLISGDQVLPKISSNVSLYPSNEHGDPLGEYLASLDELETLPPDTLVLPAHGLPFATLHRRIGALRAGHAGRLQAIAAACAQPRSTAAIVGQLFPVERFDALNRLLATTETLAHLRHLELRGTMRREGSGPGLRWIGA